MFCQWLLSPACLTKELSSFMFSGMLFIFAPLVVGYLIPISRAALLEKINQSTSYLIYVILSLMGLSLAALDNLSSNLQSILLYAGTFFVCLSLCNLLALPIIDKIIPLQTNHNQNKLPLSSMALESVKLIVVVGGGLIAGLILPIGLEWVDTASEWILFLLLFFIGIQLRNSGLTLRQILLNKQGMKHYGYEGLAVLVSERGHYSLKKAADVLGLGQEGLVAVKTDANNRIVVDDLKAKIAELKEQNIKPIAVIGVAGTTETGNVDPLSQIAQVCQEHNCHFHVHSHSLCP